MKEQIQLLHTAYEYLIKLIEGTLETAVYFQSGQEYDGFQSISLIADGIIWLIKAIDLTRQVQTEHIETESIMEIVSQINDAMLKRDTVMIGDLLEFEINPILQEWLAGIQKTLNVNRVLI